MPKFTNDQLKCSFSLPDRPTVRQQLAWYSELGYGLPRFEQWWNGARTIIEDWECEALPDRQTSLDDVSDPTQTQIIVWAGGQVLVYMNGLNDLPKN